MKLTVSPAPARAAALAAVSARAFVALTVDAPASHNGAFLCPLIAGLLALPWLLCLNALRRTQSLASVLFALLIPVVLLDGAVTAWEIAGSAGYLALDRVSLRLLLAPVGLAALWCVCRNGDAMGYAATLWARLFPALLLLIVALQARCFRPEWLRPLLGSGMRAIAGGGVRLAGQIIPCTALLALTGGTSDARRDGVMLAVASLVPALLIALHRMMVPTPLSDAGWLIRLDSLLTNGRAPLYLQLPMICAWYAGLFHLMVCECFTGAALLQRLMPRMDGRLCAALAIAATLLAAGFLPVLRLAGAVSPWLYVAVMPVAGILAITASRRKGGAGICA